MPREYIPPIEVQHTALNNRLPLRGRLEKLANAAFCHCVTSGYDDERARRQIGRVAAACKGLQDLGMRVYGWRYKRQKWEETQQNYGELSLELEDAVNELLMTKVAIEALNAGQEPPAGGDRWSRPISPGELARVLGLSSKTIGRRLKNGTLPNRMINSKSYRVDLGHLPEMTREKYREPANRTRNGH